MTLPKCFPRFLRICVFFAKNKLKKGAKNCTEQYVDVFWSCQNGYIQAFGGFLSADGFHSPYGL